MDHPTLIQSFDGIFNCGSRFCLVSVRSVILYSDNLSAGFPSAAEGYEDEPLNLHNWLVLNPAATFFYRIRGDELRAEHVRDGSILVVDRSLHPRLGRLVIIEEAGAFVVCRFQADRPMLVCGVVVAAVTRF